MNILTIMILCFMMLTTGCSACCDRSESLWIERKMEDDRRIYGNPNKSWNRWEGTEIDKNKR
ncbi:MAG: hypothetical protein AMJ65_15635 [Phycisphaerae bacterium SG8_4]|nr:MAG: hypothetical protein AMJ65_15635 [Phycisphaerae bacterium SG8_4]